MTEIRATYLDLLSRAKFIEPGEPIHDTRWHLEDQEPVVVSADEMANKLSMGTELGILEVG